LVDEVISLLEEFATEEVLIGSDFVNSAYFMITIMDSVTIGNWIIWNLVAVARTITRDLIITFKDFIIDFV
jgi:hypothetical protein